MKPVLPTLLLAGVALTPLAMAQPAPAPLPGADILFQPSPLTTMPAQRGVAAPAPQPAAPAAQPAKPARPIMQAQPTTPAPGGGVAPAAHPEAAPVAAQAAPAPAPSPAPAAQAAAAPAAPPRQIWPPAPTRQPVAAPPAAATSAPLAAAATPSPAGDKPQTEPPAPVAAAPAKSEPAPAPVAEAAPTPAPAPVLERLFGAAARKPLAVEAAAKDAPRPVPLSAVAAGAPPVPALRDGGRLRHLPNNAQGYRLAGEIGASEWAVYLTDAQASGSVHFQLGYLSAVSVMPEASQLVVRLNDVEIGRSAIQAPHSVKTLGFDIPPGLAKAGFNALRVSVDQRHRVDCSMQATYELWTQIDPAQTGFTFGSDVGVASVADIPALAPDPQGALPIRAMLPEQTSLANIDRMMRAVQAIAINARFEQVLVDVDAGAASDAYGLNLAVGPWDALRQLPGLEGLRAPDGPTLTVLPAASGRPTIVATGATAAEADQAVARLERALSARGSEAGLRAAAAIPGLRVEGGQRLRLRDFGVSSQEFSGRMYRAAFNVMLPPDFYGADYAKVTLDLAGGYSAGLTGDAQIVVSVNGRNVTGSKLPKTGGEVFDGRSIPIPLSALRPGLNRVELEAQLPTPGDAACDPLTALRKQQRFLLLESTELVVPPIARIARMPDLAVTATGGFPYAGEERRPLLYMPRPDRQTVAAAATLAARMAVSAGRPIGLRATTRAPSLGEEATLVVGAAPSIDKEVLRAAGVDPEVLAAAWPDANLSAQPETASPRLDTLARYNVALQRNFPAACHGVSGFVKAVRPKPAAPVAAERDSDAMAREWRETQRADSHVWALGRRAVGVLRDSGGMLRRLAGAFVRRLAPERPDDDLTQVIGPGSALLMAQSSLNRGEDGVWTLVTAPSPSALNEAMACAVDPRVWAQLRGRLAALDPTEAQVSSLAARDLAFVSTQPLSIGNARLIAAGWFSSNRWTYVGLVLALAIALGAATFWLVRNLGRRQA